MQYFKHKLHIPDQQQRCCQCLSTCAADQSASASSPAQIHHQRHNAQTVIKKSVLKYDKIVNLDPSQRNIL